MINNFSPSFGSNYNKQSAVTVLIIINIIVFVIINILRDVPWMMYLGLVPSLVLSRLMLWQLVSYLFVHAGLWHLVLNMLMLWMFGTVLEQTWGSRKFLGYYFFTGIGAGICSIVFAHNATYPVVGASGAIFGLLVAFAIMFPESVILLFFIFPMKMRYAAMVLAGINLLGALSNPGSEVAYIAHLGGGMFGYFYFKNQTIRSVLAKLSIADWYETQQRKKEIKKQNDLRNINQRVDEILDKISSQGIESLSKNERKILEQKSKL
ncbi:MAG: rhomboid family intramembrane serine protease [Candidatus Omnitrophica bacterium]|nr:rhomboid family intramembrane serine protease [Candidatus Omnitrophota bacterium]